MLRRLTFDRVKSSVMTHHGYLLAGVEHGNVYKLMAAAASVIDGHDSSRVLAAIAQVRTMTMAEFVYRVSCFREVIATSAFQFDVRLPLRLF